MTVTEAIEFLDNHIENSSVGLPEEVFFFVSRMTPLINVDLLIKDEQGRFLLAWRDYKYDGKGWNLPGGIVRFKETLETRILKVAETEVGAKIEFEPNPIAINQLISKQNTRGHFISLLYRCSLSSSFIPRNSNVKEGDMGFLKWHSSCPDNLINPHEMYRKFLK